MSKKENIDLHFHEDDWNSVADLKKKKFPDFTVAIDVLPVKKKGIVKEEPQELAGFRSDENEGKGQMRALCSTVNFLKKEPSENDICAEVRMTVHETIFCKNSNEQNSHELSTCIERYNNYGVEKAIVNERVLSIKEEIESDDDVIDVKDARVFFNEPWGKCDFVKNEKDHGTISHESTGDTKLHETGGRIEYVDCGVKVEKSIIIDDNGSINKKYEREHCKNVVESRIVRIEEAAHINMKNVQENTSKQNMQHIDDSSEAMNCDNILNVKEEYENEDVTDNEAMDVENTVVIVKEDPEGSNGYVEDDTPSIQRNISRENTMKNKLDEKVVALENWNDIEYKVDVQEPIVHINVKNEPVLDQKDQYLYCEECGEEYESFCTKCPMLLRILHTCVSNTTDDQAEKTLPRNILEIRDSFGRPGIFALKTIPKNVILGPYGGLKAKHYSTAGFTWHIINGKLIHEGNEKFLNWMRHINTADSASNRNLVPFQYKKQLYCRTDREIKVGEELLVYYSEGFIHLKDTENCYNISVETELEDGHTCAFCCLGFRSETHLKTHKTKCPQTDEDVLEEIPKCSFCKGEEDSEYQMECYCGRQKRMSPPRSRRRRKPGIQGNYEALQLDPAGNPKPITTLIATYKCATCDYATFVKHNLHQHNKTQHAVGGTVCDCCKRHFHSVGHLRRHQAAAYCDHEKRRCDVCCKKFLSRRSRMIHMNTFHLGIGRLQCPKCDYQTNYAATLNKHLDDVHETRKKRDVAGEDAPGEIPTYKCPKCLFQTIYERSLKRHMYVHVEVRPFKCGQCPKAFCDGDKLKRHVRTCHRDMNRESAKCVGDKGEQQSRTICKGR